MTSSSNLTLLDSKSYLSWTKTSVLQSSLALHTANLKSQTQPSISTSLHVGLALFTLEQVFMLDYRNHMLETKKLKLEL